MFARSHKLGPVLGVTVVALVVLLVVETRISRTHVDVVAVEIQPSSGLMFDEDSPGDAPLGDSAGPLHDEARVLARRAELDAAFERYRRLVRRHPVQGGLWAEYGYWLLVDRQDAAALEVLERSARLSPRDPWVALLLGHAHSRAGELDEAEASVRRALELAPRDVEARLTLGRLLLRQERASEAAQHYAELAAFRDTEPGALALAGLGRAKLALGDADGGHRALQLAVERAPASVGVRLAAARAWLATGEPEDLPWALALMDETIAMAPEIPQLHSTRGLALELSGELDEAGRAYEEALRLEPGAQEVRCRLEALDPALETLQAQSADPGCQALPVEVSG